MLSPAGQFTDTFHSTDAEGNGDSISAAVQAERIALLTSVLAQTHLGEESLRPEPEAHVHQGPHHSLPPPRLQQQQHSTIPRPNFPIVRSNPSAPLQQYGSAAPALQDYAPAALAPRHMSRDQSQFETAIYQTAPVAHSPVRHQSLQNYPTQGQSQRPPPRGPSTPQHNLPSFLHEMVHHSPSLTSTSTEFPPYDDFAAVGTTHIPVRQQSTQSMSSGHSDSSRNRSTQDLSHIWRMGGEESRHWSVASPNNEWMGRRDSREPSNDE